MSGDESENRPRDEEAVERPAWLSEPCPVWCDRDHRGQEMVEDRAHWSIASPVPVVALTRHRDGQTSRIVREVVAVELQLVASKRVGEDEVWVTLADDASVIEAEITIESVRRLHQRLGSLLEQL